MDCPKCADKMVASHSDKQTLHKCPMCNFEVKFSFVVRPNYVDAWIHVCDLDVIFVEGDKLHYNDVEFIARSRITEINAYVCEVITTDKNDGRFACVHHDVFADILDP